MYPIQGGNRNTLLKLPHATGTMISLGLMSHSAHMQTYSRCCDIILVTVSVVAFVMWFPHICQVPVLL